MQHIISFFTSENIIFCNIFTYPLIFIEYLLLLYFSKILFDFKTSTSDIFKIVILAFIGATFKLIFPLPFNLIPTFFILIAFFSFVYRLFILKSFLCVGIFTGLLALVEYVINLIVIKLFNYNLFAFSLIPIFKLLSSFILYFFIYFILRIFKHFYTDSFLYHDINNKESIKSVIVILATLIIMLPNYIFLTLLDMNLPTIYIIYNIFAAFIFFFLGLYSTNRITKLQLTQRELETANLYNSTLSKLVDSNRAFRHDIANIITSIGGYIELNDMDGLNNYYTTGLLPEINKSNNLSLLNPDVINSPPLFGLLLDKYNYADSLNVKIELQSFFDYSSINMNIFDFVKIFGILLDNAIEAASLCNDKLVSIYVTIDFYNRKQIFKISNTFLNKDIDINQIFLKDFSTKKVKSGFGLWEVNQLLKKYPNSNLLTSKDDSLFYQKLEIFF